jgi:predicted transcriptional regulator
LKDAVLEEIAELLFILASIDRLQLLSEIGVKKSRLGELTNKISATPQETSKHLMRLRSAQLIEKDPDGFFGLTALGKIVLTILPSINFLAQHKDYFLHHDISSLPPELVRRIGELQGSVYVEKVGSVLVHARRVLREAEEYIWLMADHSLEGEEPLVSSGKLNDSQVKWKIIVPAGTNIDWPLLRMTVGDNKGKMAFYLLENASEVAAGIALNEKIAALSLPDNNGKIDFNSGFTSDNPAFRNWCQDLFSIHLNKKGRSVQI